MEEHPEPLTLGEATDRAPERIAEALFRVARKGEQESGTLAQIAKECGLKASVASAIAQKLQREYLPLKRAIGEVRRDELRDLYHDVAWRALTSISDDKLAEMRGDKLMLTAAIATDKALLLDHQPTQILSVKELRGLDQLMGVLVEEARRRGGTIEMTPEGGSQVVTRDASEARNERVLDVKNPTRAPV